MQLLTNSVKMSAMETHLLGKLLSYIVTVILDTLGHSSSVDLFSSHRRLGEVLVKNVV